MKYDTIGLSPKTIQDLTPETLHIWNGTSWANAILVAAGWGSCCGGDSAGPDDEDRANAVQLIEKALQIVEGAPPNSYHKNIRSYRPEPLLEAAKNVCLKYREDPNHRLTDLELNALLKNINHEKS